MDAAAYVEENRKKKKGFMQLQAVNKHDKAPINKEVFLISGFSTATKYFKGVLQ
jgi:hypothetical protein